MTLKQLDESIYRLIKKRLTLRKLKKAFDRVMDTIISDYIMGAKKSPQIYLSEVIGKMRFELGTNLKIDASLHTYYVEKNLLRVITEWVVSSYSELGFTKLEKYNPKLNQILVNYLYTIKIPRYGEWSVPELTILEQEFLSIKGRAVNNKIALSDRQIERLELAPKQVQLREVSEEELKAYAIIMMEKISNGSSDDKKVKYSTKGESLMSMWKRYNVLIKHFLETYSGSLLDLSWKLDHRGRKYPVAYSGLLGLYGDTFQKSLIVPLGYQVGSFSSPEIRFLSQEFDRVPKYQFGQRLNLKFDEEIWSNFNSSTLFKYDTRNSGFTHLTRMVLKGVESLRLSNLYKSSVIYDTHQRVADAFGVSREIAKEINTAVLHGGSINSMAKRLGVAAVDAEKYLISVYGKEVLLLNKLAKLGTWILKHRTNASYIQFAPDGYSFGVQLSQKFSWEGYTIYQDMPTFGELGKSFLPTEKVAKAKTKAFGLCADIVHYLDSDLMEYTYRVMGKNIVFDYLDCWVLSDKTELVETIQKWHNKPINRFLEILNFLDAKYNLSHLSDFQELLEVAKRPTPKVDGVNFLKQE